MPNYVVMLLLKRNPLLCHEKNIPSWIFSSQFIVHPYRHSELQIIIRNNRRHMSGLSGGIWCQNWVSKWGNSKNRDPTISKLCINYRAPVSDRNFHLSTIMKIIIITLFSNVDQSQAFMYFKFSPGLNLRYSLGFYQKS